MGSFKFIIFWIIFFSKKKMFTQLACQLNTSKNTTQEMPFLDQ